MLIKCIGAESQHRAPKRIMHFSYNDACKSAMAHWINTFAQKINNGNTFVPIRLTGPLIARFHEIMLEDIGLVTIVSSSSSITTKIGGLGTNESFLKTLKA